MTGVEQCALQIWTTAQKSGQRCRKADNVGTTSQKSGQRCRKCGQRCRKADNGAEKTRRACVWNGLDHNKCAVHLFCADGFSERARVIVGVSIRHGVQLAHSNDSQRHIGTQCPFCVSKEWAVATRVRSCWIEHRRALTQDLTPARLVINEWFRIRRSVAGGAAAFACPSFE